jgi:hypothetical protein
MQPLPWGSYFQAGIVVPDIEAAREELSRGLGLTWTDTRDFAVGDSKVRICFSRQGPPWLELLEGDGPWDASNGPLLHHLGMWVPDLDEASRQLADAGIAVDYDPRPAGYRVVYHLGAASGLRVEIFPLDGKQSFLERWGFSEPDQ